MHCGKRLGRKHGQFKIVATKSGFLLALAKVLRSMKILLAKHLIKRV